MAFLPEPANWSPGIYQLETSDPVVGGPDGIDNLQAKQLAARTVWLKQQVEGKAAAGHGHAVGDVAGLQGALDGKAAVGHSHAISNVIGLQGALDGKAAAGHGHAIGDVAGLQAALDGRSLIGHSHAISSVIGLQGALDGKQPNLGFVPVHQGGGNGQSTNTVYIGWATTGDRLRLQVDSTDFGATWPIHITGNAGYANAAGSVPLSGVPGLQAALDSKAHTIDVLARRRAHLTAESVAGSRSLDDLLYQPAEHGFQYGTAGSGVTGPFLHIGSLNGTNNYHLQITASYQGGNTLKFRTHNSDSASSWNPWRRVWTDADGTPAWIGHGHAIGDVGGLQATLDGKAAAIRGVPTGAVAHFATSAPPAGWLVCNGASLSRAAYPDLFAAIGTTFGSYSADTFLLPDLRGVFIRGLDGGRGQDPAWWRSLGSYQADAFASHAHVLGSEALYQDYGSSGGYVGARTYPEGSHPSYRNPSTSSVGDSETRPKNLALLPCIKY